MYIFKSPRCLETERFELRQVCLNDASFLLELFNDPGFIQNIGDRGVRSEQQAQTYLKSNVIKRLSTTSRFRLCIATVCAWKRRRI